MQMKLKELIAALEKIQTISGEDANTNVNAARVKAEVYENWPDASPYQISRRENVKRELSYSVWIESYTDGPVAPAQTDPNTTWDPA